ncbi:hypothetical protein [Planobispora rosea]|nr:hypothetical protein [Planobispora rosea]
MCRTRPFTAAAGAAAIALAAPLMFGGPAAAEPYGTRWCTTNPLPCGTSPGLEPHSTEGWLEVRLAGPGCHVRWDLYELRGTNWPHVAGGSKFLLTSSTFKVRNLDTTAYYRLEVSSLNCVVTGRLRNFT